MIETLEACAGNQTRAARLLGYYHQHGTRIAHPQSPAIVYDFRDLTSHAVMHDPLRDAGPDND